MVEHQLEDFSCGESSLDDWLQRRALPNQASGASRTFVVTSDTGHVMAYYALAAGAVSHQDSPGKRRRNMPDPVPVLVLARLAVDQRLQGRQVGGALLQDAVQRALSVAEDIGVRALMVHALNEQAVRFYTHYGFVPSPADPMTLMLPLHAWETH
ncbi:GNAT family N-acetyltransferase [Thiohalocapsa marina]|uniref:GNAT family N-acetyltransferase n=1 Tax=Thiohalocapsa marina TaxID=424902 RepID=UPI001FEB9D41|nr:GNAT family N-acetyltransferase [Thiohalocapsa marina]